MDLALRARIYCPGLLGFVAVVVHGNDSWTGGSAFTDGACGTPWGVVGARIVAGTVPERFDPQVYRIREALSV